MIIVADSIRKLDFSKLTALCGEEIQQIRKAYFNQFDLSEGLIKAENDFYHYLKASFFAVGGLYFIQTEGERYVCAVRFDPYEEGLLLNALVTAPEFRRRGYAYGLLRYAFEYITDKNIYSHVSVRNIASLNLHEKLGFSLIYDYARMLNGSVRNDHVTYIRMP